MLPAKNPRLEEAANIVDSFGKTGIASCGLLVFQTDGFLIHRDCFGWKVADETNARIRSLLDTRAKKYGGAFINAENSLHPKFMVVGPDALLSQQLARDIYDEFNNLSIRTIDEGYLKEYPSTPKSNLRLTTAVVLIDRITLIGPTYNRIDRAMVLHEICEYERPGLITVFDLTVCNENT
jgi:hypothetical protein